MNISMIAAVGKNLELGKGNDLIWHFKDDMRFFKEKTTGNTVIMGRKTFESLPHALPNRRNIVITTDKSYVAQGAELLIPLTRQTRFAAMTMLLLLAAEMSTSSICRLQISCI